MKSILTPNVLNLTNTVSLSETAPCSQGYRESENSELVCAQSKSRVSLRAPIDDLQSDTCGSPTSQLATVRTRLALLRAPAGPSNGNPCHSCPGRAMNERAIVAKSARKANTHAIGDRHFYDKGSNSKAFMRCLLRGS